MARTTIYAAKFHASVQYQSYLEPSTQERPWQATSPEKRTGKVPEAKMPFGVTENGILMAPSCRNKKIVRTSVSFDKRICSDVAEIASQHDLSVAWVVRKAVDELLERQRQNLPSHIPLLTPPAQPEDTKA